MHHTDEKIQAYKAQHGDIFLIEVESGETCLVRCPTRQDLSYVSAVKDPIAMSELMLKTLWLEGDETILTDDRLFMAVIPKLEEVIKVKEATIKKL